VKTVSGKVVRDSLA